MGLNPKTGKPSKAWGVLSQEELKSLAGQSTGDAIETLAWICKHGEKESNRITAAVALLDRCYGKPAQTVNATVTNVDPRLVSDRELLAIFVADDEEPPGRDPDLVGTPGYTQ
jgi:hypothetical protein